MISMDEGAKLAPSSCARAWPEVSFRSVFVYRSGLVSGANTVTSNEVGLRLLCCGMCFPYIYLFVATRQNSKLTDFPKGFVE